MSFIEILEVAEKVVVVTGGLSAAYLALKRYTDKLDKTMTGTWTNEGDVTLSVTHFVDLDLELEDGEISGVLNARNLSTDNEMKYVSVVGKRFLWWGKADLCDVKRGEFVTYGSISLRLKGKRMSWKLAKGNSDFFPQVTPLWKWDKPQEVIKQDKPKAQ